MASDNKQIARNLIFNTASFAINLAISFFFTPYLIRTLGKEAYGFFPLVNNIISYSSILTAAFGSMAGRFITMSFYKGDIDGANKYFNSVWVANIGLSIFFTLISIIFIVNISSILTVPDYLLNDVKLLFAFALGSMVISLLTGMFGLGTYVKNRIDLQSSITVLTNVVRVACILLLFYLFVPSIVYISLSGLIGALVGMCFNLSFKKKLLPELSFAPFSHFSFKAIKTVLNSGIWNSVNQLSHLLLTQLDLLITNIFIGVAATGDYAIAKTAPTMILHLLTVLSGTFAPHFNILYAKGEIDNLVSEVNKSMMLISLLIGIPIGFLLVFSGNFYDLWVPGQNTETLYWLTFITVLPMIFGGSVNPVFGIFAATNRLRVPSLVLLAAGILNTLAIFILLKTTNLGIWAIPLVGAVQGALRNCLFTTMYGAHCINKRLTVFFPSLIKGIIGMLVVVIISVLTKQVVAGVSWLSFVLAFAIVVILSLIANSFLLLNKNERHFLMGKMFALCGRK